MLDYKRSLYSKTVDVASAEYAKTRSEVYIKLMCIYQKQNTIKEDS